MHQWLPHSAVDEQSVDQQDARSATAVAIMQSARTEFDFGNGAPPTSKGNSAEPFSVQRALKLRDGDTLQLLL